jgi:glycosyltransferase involved in cell wall biosynthesis
MLDRKRGSRDPGTSIATLLLCDLAPYLHSTRTKKVGEVVGTSTGPVKAVTLSRVGRLGMADDASFYLSSGVEVEQVRVGKISSRRTLTASLRNLFAVYAPAILRLRRRVLEIPAHTIFIGHVSLFWLGLAHQRRWDSHIIINGRERPGGIRTKGSLATWFSKIEPFVLRRVARRQPTLLAVCDSHANEFRALGFNDVRVVRNVPSISFAPNFVPPADSDELVVCCVGSLYPGRGVEALIDGAVLARRRGADVRLEITGPASDAYARTIQARIDDAEELLFTKHLIPRTTLCPTKFSRELSRAVQ